MMVQTEIGLLPEDWEVKAIGECLSIGNGRDYKHLHRGIVPVYGTGGIMTYVDQYLYDGETVCIGRKGTIDNPMYHDGKIWTVDTLFYSHHFKAVPKYMYYAFCQVDWMSYNEATGVPSLTSKRIEEIQVPLPPQSEQQNIASALSSIDKLIDDLGRTIQKKQRIREGAMEELLSGKKRLPGFKDEWVEKRIGDIGKTYSGLTGKTKEDFGHGDAKYITFLNVLNNAILDISIFEAVDVRPNEKQNAAHYGDLFFNTSSETPEDVGTCACLNTEVPNLYLNSFCFGYRLNDEEVYGNFLAYFFRTKAGRDIMYSLAQGATRYNLSKEYFNEIKITMPPTIKEQQSISYVFEAMTDEISLLESERAKYEQIRSGMMEELLTGKKRLIKK